MTTASLAASLSFTPPLGGSAVTISFNGSEIYTPQNVGTLDIPIGTSSHTVFTVPFGGVNVADAVLIKNRGNQDLGVRINGIPTSPAVLYQIPPNGFFMMFNPVVAGGSPLTAVVVETVAAQSGQIGQVDYYVFGAT
ncbi:MAG TPA: hypothetical protein VIE65_11140 [Methylobacter sp.]|jgi:hypothetical protein